jgi:predicted MFS family arabinose efflux permease
MGLLPVALGIVSYFLVKESEGWRRDQSSGISIKKSLFDSEHRNNLWKGAIIFGSMLIGLWALFLWMPTWVQSLLKNSDGQTERGLSMMLLGIGGLTGGFFSGWISNVMGIRKAMMLCFAGYFVMAILLFKFNTSFSIIIYPEIALLALFFGVSQGLLSVYIPLLFPSVIRATATGFCFNIGRLFTAAAVFFVGAMVTTLGGYGNSLLTFSIVFLLGLITIYFTKEKN